MHTLVIPLMPAVPELLGVSQAAASWLVTATMLVGAVSAPIFGRPGDLFGRRRVLLVVLGLMLAGSVLGTVGVRPARRRVNAARRCLRVYRSA